MIDRDALKRYIEENTYNEWTLSEWCDAENNWADHPEDSIEYQKLLLLRKKRERMMADEERRKNYLCLMKQKQDRYENVENYSNILNYTVYEEKRRTAFLNNNSNRKITFEKLLEYYKKERGISSDAEVCRGANLSPDILNKMKKEINYTVQRDYIWAVAVSLTLGTLDETEKLFNSCNQSINGEYKLTLAEKDRELEIEFCITEKKTITEVNKELKEHNMAILGNVITY